MENAPNPYGDVQSVNGAKVLRFEREFRHAPEKVWRALIEPSELQGWFPCQIEGERKVGATIRFVFEGEDESPAEGVIVEFDPPHVLAYTWEGESLRWELHPISGGSRLIFTSQLDPAYPADNTAAGWHLCLELLEAQLNGETVPWEMQEHMEDLQILYSNLVKS